MHSVVVVGDIRAHDVIGYEGDQKRFLWGGAYLMRAAVEWALQNLEERNRPKIFSYVQATDFQPPDVDRAFFADQSPAQQAAWDVVETCPEDHEKKRLRLRKRFDLRVLLAPQIAMDLADKLVNGDFEDSGEEWNKAVPDIVVLDDLGLQLKDVELPPCSRLSGSGNSAAGWAHNVIPPPPELKLPSAKKDASHTVGNFRDYAENVKLEALRKSIESTSLTTENRIKCRGQVMQIELSMLMRRLQFASSVHSSRDATADPIEPIVIVSLAGHLPNLKEGEGIWRRLFDEPELRKRTVVLFDAEELRKHVSISSGLSWERTAQDTITEMNRHGSLKTFLEFGHIIVRFGITGAILISHNGDTDPSYTLYFDPERDDRSWSHSTDDGVVLGSTSILVATIVEALSRRCSDRGGAPQLADLAYSLDAALTLSIRRMQCHFAYGYGTKDGGQWGKLEQDGWIPKEVFQASSETIDDYVLSAASGVAIQRVKVLPAKLRVWSILSQSVRGNRAELAKQIVRYGTKVSLNTVRDPALKFVELWLKEAVKSDANAPKGNSNSVVDKLDHVVDNMVRHGWPVVVRALGQQCANALLSAYVESGFSDVVSDAKTKLNEVRQARLSNSDDGQNDAESNEQPSPLHGAVAAESKGGGSASEMRPVNTQQVEHSDSLNSADLRVLQSYLQNFTKSVRDKFSWSEPVAAPVVRLGTLQVEGDGRPVDRRMEVVDRQEIEGIRAVKRMIENHLRLVSEEKSERPLSIAVFGPPGSGKSLSVKKIMDMLGGKGAAKTKILQFNMAEFTTREQLDNAFSKVVGVSADGEIPIVFFDEFDTEFAGKPNGWLKFFLAPMEDGMYGAWPVKKAVFVFAGGTSSTFEEFSLVDQSTELWAEFSKAKGPDFVSRLRGHLNVVGINAKDADDDLYLIRRAIVLRSLLTIEQDLTDCQEAAIDDEMLRAFLYVPHYRHGSRSVRMLLQMCKDRYGRVSKSEVPPIHQLNMQVDGNAFLELVAGPPS